MRTKNDTSPKPASDVLVVGAGPVGLFLARRLVGAGHAVRIVEAHAGQSEHSKALAIMPRTLEAFDVAGILEPFERAAHHTVAATVISHERRLGSISFASNESRFPYIAMIGQDVTERLLLESLVEAGGRVEYDTTLVAAVQDGDGVEATLQGPRGEETLRARFVVGCDGAHSTVRRILDLPFEGEEYRDTFVLIDVDTRGDVPEHEMQLCPNERGPIAIFPMGATRRRLVAMVDRRFEGEPGLELANELLSQRGPAGLRAKKLIWGSTFRIHRRLTPQMSRGGMFLAGDAAHIHSPFGAQGMNTGLQDAWNLAWKLDFALRGWGNAALLESYSAERHPIAERVIRATDVLTRAMSVSNAPAQLARDTIVPLLTRFEPFRDFFVSTISELGITLAGSPIVAGAGRRAPDEAVRRGDGEGRLYEVLRGRYLLLHPEAGADSAAALAECARRYGGVDMVQRRGDRTADIRLVRPDAYVAWEGTSRGDWHDSARRIASILGTHLQPLDVAAARSR